MFISLHIYLSKRKKKKTFPTSRLWERTYTPPPCCLFEFICMGRQCSSVNRSALSWLKGLAFVLSLSPLQKKKKEKDEKEIWSLKSNKSHLDLWSKLGRAPLILHPNYSICSLKYFNPGWPQTSHEPGPEQKAAHCPCSKSVVSLLGPQQGIIDQHCSAACFNLLN